MKKYRITKYAPQNRNDQGHYIYNHWTEISDVGKTLEGEFVTQEEYLNVEQDYINAVLQILSDSNQGYLRLVGFNKFRFQQELKENVNEWYHESSFENIDIFEDKKIGLEDIPAIIKLNLRRYLDASLEIIDKYYVQFGYDFYMYVGTPNLSQKVIDKINSTTVFVEEFWSPYYSPELEYVIQTSKKHSMYIDEESTLESISIDKMKGIFNLSEEHPGRIYSQIDSEIAGKIGIKVNLDTNKYYLTTKLKVE